MKKLLLLGLALAAVYFGGVERGLLPWPGLPDAGVQTNAEANANRALTEAFANRRSNVQVQGRGEVARVLADDNKGSRHQRFILRLASGQSVLVAHNIDLAERVASLQGGDTVEFSGEYEWNERGGVIHWTHHDPRGSHAPGWLKHNGRTYQ